jgi:hypothetical protein
MKKANTTTNKSITKGDKALYSTVISNLKTVGGKTYAAIPIQLLWVDPDYQRIISRSENKIRNLALQWNPKKMDALKVVAHPDENLFSVVDGLGRLTASQLLAPPLETLECEVDLSAPTCPSERKRYEANLFISQYDEIEILKPVQKHNASVLLGDRACIDIDRACSKYNISIVAGRGQRKSNVLGSYSAILSISKRNGYKGLCFLFDIIAQAGWNIESNGYASYVCKAINNIYSAHNEQIREVENCLCAELRPMSPIIFKAKAVAQYPMRDHRSACTLYLEDVLIEKGGLQRKIDVVNGKIVIKTAS